MRRTIRGSLSATTLVLAIACRPPGYDVQTMVAPMVRLSSFHTFELLPVPPTTAAHGVGGPSKVMLAASPEHQVLRTMIIGTFVERGYTERSRLPDIVVAVYASERGELNLAHWDYGYRTWMWRREHMQPAPPNTIFREGTVVIDVVDAITLDLLWRGATTVEMTGDAEIDVRSLQQAARAIVLRFPKASARPLVAGR